MTPSSCWNCGWQQIGGESFLGMCRWFETRGEAKKAIPATVVDAGCRWWKERERKDGV